MKQLLTSPAQGYYNSPFRDAHRRTLKTPVKITQENRRREVEKNIQVKRKQIRAQKRKRGKKLWVDDNPEAEFEPETESCVSSKNNVLKVPKTPEKKNLQLLPEKQSEEIKPKIPGFLEDLSRKVDIFFDFVTTGKITQKSCVEMCSKLEVNTTIPPNFRGKGNLRSKFLLKRVKDHFQELISKADSVQGEEKDSELKPTFVNKRVTLSESTPTPLCL